MIETMVIGIVCITSVVCILCVGMLIHDFWVYRKSREWRIDIQALQLENSRYLQKVHDENTRFFRSMGITMQQILERVDKFD